MPRIQRWYNEPGNSAGNYQARLHKDPARYWSVSKRHGFAE